MLAEASEMLSEFVRRERGRAGGLQRDCRTHDHTRQRCGDVRFDFEWFSSFAANDECDPGSFARFDAACITLLEAFVQCGIVSFPDAMAGAEFGKINFAVLEVESLAAHLVNASTLLGVCITAGIEDHAVTRFQCDCR